ncbi:hypothetical protein EVAR_4318_1 [Eumeta japonica]|uniref:Uncharacterized protein n=1 Tax=Eumeta variegata TaxID=151549 RepID=A0A4C1VDZ5_EUMVA|nr:hypothetical protein EVAR_4318_1 [Eumeta japonica]
MHPISWDTKRYETASNRSANGYTYKCRDNSKHHLFIQGSDRIIYSLKTSSRVTNIWKLVFPVTNVIRLLDIMAELRQRHRSAQTIPKPSVQEVVEIHDGGERIIREKVIPQTRVNNRPYDVKVEMLSMCFAGRCSDLSGKRTSSLYDISSNEDAVQWDYAAGRKELSDFSDTDLAMLQQRMRETFGASCYIRSDGSITNNVHEKIRTSTPGYLQILQDRDSIILYFIVKCLPYQSITSFRRCTTAPPVVNDLYLLRMRRHSCSKYQKCVIDLRRFCRQFSPKKNEKEIEFLSLSLPSRDSNFLILSSKRYSRSRPVNSPNSPFLQYKNCINICGMSPERDAVLQQAMKTAKVVFVLCRYGPRHDHSILDSGAPPFDSSILAESVFFSLVSIGTRDFLVRYQRTGPLNYRF